MHNIAILSSAFFPFPGVGSVRTTNWARMLAERGHRVTVITRFNGHTASAQRLREQLGENVDVRTFGPDGNEMPLVDLATQRSMPPGLRRSLQRQLSQLWIPDAEIRFWKRVYPTLQRVIRDNQCELAITSHPQASVLDVGRWLRRDLGLPWIADFRDPVLLDERMRPHGLAWWTLPLRRQWLDRIYTSADAVTHALPVQARWARRVYPDRRRRFATLRHPVPSDLATNSVPPLLSEVPGRRVIAIVGSLPGEEAMALGCAMASLVADPSGEYDLELRLIGAPPPNAQALQTLLGDRVAIVGPVAHDIAKQHMAGASVLVNALSVERSKHLGISSKLYEYAAARKPIITIRPTRCDRELLRFLPSQTLETPDVAALVAALQDALGRDPQQVAQDLEPFIQRFCWESHCRQLEHIVASVLNPPSEGFDLREQLQLSS